MKNLKDQELNLEAQTSFNYNNLKSQRIHPSHIVKQTSLLALSLTATNSFATPAIIIDTPSESSTNIKIDKIILPELMIIDSRLKNIDNLVERRRKGLIPIVVQQDENGLDAISQAMLKYPDAATIHIVSHGKPGGILLGSTAINEDQLNTKTGSLNQWRNDKVLARPDLIVYGCNVAKGQAGQQFINKLSQLTGFDVAASTNLTGQSSLGGDWKLESNTGWIEASLAWQDTDIKQFQGVLANITVNSLADSGAGTLRDALDNQVADGDTVTFSVTGTITLTTGELTVANDITINGPGVANLSIDANGDSRVMTINRSNVTISNVTITGGSAQGAGGGIRSYYSDLNIQDSAINNNFVAYFGGGIGATGYDSSLTISNSSITNNNTRNTGGGVGFAYGTLTINDTIISNNIVSGNSGSTGNGGGLALGNGTMTINNTTITGNTASVNGGGISAYSRGNRLSLSISGGAISNNSTTRGTGGGINIATNNYRPRKSSVNSITVSGGPAYYYSSGLNLDSVTINANTAGGNGGGINIEGNSSRARNKAGYGYGRIPNTNSIVNSTISNNFSLRDGGGLSLSVGYGDKLELSNSTVSGNGSNGNGAGIALKSNNRPLASSKGQNYTTTHLDLINTTVVNNSSQTTAGGIYNSGYLSIQNSIVANNTTESGGADLHNRNGAILASSLVENLNYSASVVDNGGNIFNTDPLLGPTLQNNGGPTLTHQLMAGSPAIDAGSNAHVSALNEQRGTGFTRILNSTVDMGAVEGTAGLTPVNASATLSSIQVVETAGVVTYTIRLNNPAPATGITIDLDFSGSASEGVDYTASGRQIVIPPGATSGFITFNIIDDGLPEPDEIIIIEIIGITNAAVSGPSTATLTILASGAGFATPAIIPTLSNWATILLSLLLPAFVMRRFRKPKKVDITYS